jgi:hypothetical protein
MAPYVSIGAQYVNDELEGESLTFAETVIWERDLADVETPQDAEPLAKRIRSSRHRGQSSDVVMVDPDVVPDAMGGMRADAIAVSALLAVEANDPAIEPNVHEWREAHLGSGVRLVYEEVEQWLDETGADEQPTTMVTFAAPPGVTFERVGDGYVPSEPIVFDPSHPLKPPFRTSHLVLTFGKPGSTASFARLCAVGSVLDQLRTLSEGLANRYRWSKGQATIFVLTGLTPVLSQISIELRTVGATPGAEEVRITVRPTATPEDVMEAFRTARKKFFGTRTRSIPSRQAHLVLHRLGRLHNKPDESWTETQVAWNQYYERRRPGWKFTSAKQVRRDFNAARRRLLEHERRSP